MLEELVFSVGSFAPQPHHCKIIKLSTSIFFCRLYNTKHFLESKEGEKFLMRFYENILIT